MGFCKGKGDNVPEVPGTRVRARVKPVSTWEIKCREVLTLCCQFCTGDGCLPAFCALLCSPWCCLAHSKPPINITCDYHAFKNVWCNNKTIRVSSKIFRITTHLCKHN